MQQRVKFNHEKDMLLLREVLVTRAPLQKAAMGWKEVTNNLLQLPQFPDLLTFRAVRDRTTLLLSQYSDRKKEYGLLREEEMSEKDLMLEQLVCMKVKENPVEHEEPMKSLFTEKPTKIMKLQLQMEKEREELRQLTESGNDNEVNDMNLSYSRRIYYTPADDIDLLTECLAVNPWRQKSGFVKMANLKRESGGQFINVETKSVRERINTLIQRFRQGKMQIICRSGNEEEYAKRDELLKYVSDMEYEYSRSGKRQSSYDPDVSAKAAKIDEQSTHSEQSWADNESVPAEDDNNDNTGELDLKCESGQELGEATESAELDSINEILPMHNDDTNTTSVQQQDNSSFSNSASEKLLSLLKRKSEDSNKKSSSSSSSAQSSGFSIGQPSVRSLLNNQRRNNASINVGGQPANIPHVIDVARPQPQATTGPQNVLLAPGTGPTITYTPVNNNGMVNNTPQVGNQQLLFLKNPNAPPDDERKLKEKELDIRQQELDLQREELEQRKQEHEQSQEMFRRMLETDKEERARMAEMLSKQRDEMSQIVSQQMSMMATILELVINNKK